MDLQSNVLGVPAVSWGRASLVGLVLGLVCALPVLAGIDGDPAADLGVHHNPPLVVPRGEPVTLEFGLVCPYEEGGGECRPEGDLFIRGTGAGPWQRLALGEPSGEEWLLTAEVPPALRTPPGFEYYAEVRTGTGAAETYPPSGRDGPLEAAVVPHAAVTVVDIGPRPAQPEAWTVFEAGWGAGPGQVGLEVGDESATIGPSSFDVLAGGGLALYDAVNRRVVLDGPAGRSAVTSPSAAAFVDVAAAADGTLYLLELVPGGDRTLDLFAVEEGGVRHAGAAAEGMADALRRSGGEVHARQYPSDSWRPLVDGGGAVATRAQQLRRGRAGKRGAGGGELALKVTEDRVRLALTPTGGATSMIELRTPARFGEGQLAETLGDGSVVLVVREVGSSGPWFRMLRVTPAGEILWDASTEPVEWAQSAPVSRFRLGPDGGLYHMRSGRSGFDIVRHDLGN